MSKRSSIEENVTQFFSSADYVVAKTVFAISKGIMKRRADEEEMVHSASQAASKPRKRAKPKVQSKVKQGHGAATNADRDDGDDMETVGVAV